MPRLILAIVAGLLVAAPAAASDPELVLDVHPQIVAEPGVVEMRIYLEPNAADRLLTVEADSLALYRSSTIQLSGAESPRSHYIDLKYLPAGRYAVRVTLMREGGVAGVANSHFRVTGIEDE